MLVRRTIDALLLAVLATALPQVPDEPSSLVSATNPIADIPSMTTSTATARSATSLASETLTSAAGGGSTGTGTSFVSATNTLGSPLPTGRNSTFVGWSSWSSRSGTTRYNSLYCSRSSIYLNSVHSDGTTYAGCCSASNLANCFTRTLAHYCVNNVQMAGNQTISDCGTSTCAHALVYQNLGDEEAGVEPVRFHHCAAFGSRGGTVYRTLPASKAVTTPLWATSTSSSSSLRDGDSALPQRMGAAIAGGVIAFLIVFVVLPVCILRRMRKGQKSSGAASEGTGRYQAAPPRVTVPEPAPPYQRGGGGDEPVGQAYTTLDPGRGGGEAVPWVSMGNSNASAPPKPNDGTQEMQDLPPRYKDVGGTRVGR